MKAVARDVKGKKYVGYWTQNAWNKALALGNTDLLNAPDLTSGVAALLRRSNHSASSSMSMDKDHILTGATLLPLTVFYVASHGADDPHFQDCVSTNIMLHGIYGGDIGSVLLTNQPPWTKRVPPPSTEAYPQYNFSFIDSCESAGNKLKDPPTLTNKFAHDFGIRETAKDRCWMGWNLGTMDSSRNAKWVLTFFGLLRDGYPVVAATGLASRKTARPRGTIGLSPQTVGEIEPVFVGDWLTKIYELYYPAEPLQITSPRNYNTREWCVRDVQ